MKKVKVNIKKYEQSLKNKTNIERLSKDFRIRSAEMKLIDAADLVTREGIE